MSEQTPAERLVDILKAELPGFASEIHAATDTIRVRGWIKFNAQAALDTVYMVPDGQRAIESLAEYLIERTRNHVIELVGLRKLMDARVTAAGERGQHRGYIEGKAAGIAEGRRQMLAEVLAAREEDDLDG
jgi:hypothetical protein